MRWARRAGTGALSRFESPDRTLAALDTVRASVARHADAMLVADSAVGSSRGSGRARGAWRAALDRFELARSTLGAVTQRRSAGPAKAAHAVRRLLPSSRAGGSS